MNNIDLGTTGVAIKSKSLTLNLNGKTITYGGGSDAIELDSNAGLTVTDGGSGGKLEATAHLGRAIHNYDSGTVVVEGGTVSATGPSGFAIDNYAGTVKVTGGTVSATGEAGFAINNFLSGTVVVEGGTVSATGESGTAIYNKIRGTVTVKGGTVSAAGSLGVAIRNDSTGEIKVESGTVSADNGSYVIQNNSTGTVTVKGGTVSAENGDGIAIMNNNEGKITVEGGAVSIVNGNGTAIANESTGTVTVEGGKVCAVNGNGNAIANRSNGKVVVSGGTVSATGHSGKAIWNDLNGKIIISGTAVVTSRNTAANQGTIYFNGVPTPAAVVLEISGGEVENTAADGYAVYFTPSRVTSANLSSYYSHTGGTVGRVRPAPTPAIAVELWRGDSKVSPDGDFDTLAAAIDAAQDGDTLKIMADINLGTTGVDIKGKTLILDLNGQTITYSGDQNAISLVNTASLTVTDGGTGGKLEATGNGGYAIMNGTSGTISVTGGTVSASGSSGVAIADLSRGNIKISGNAAITSKNASATEGTIFITGIPLSADVALEITGSKVENTVTDGYAVYFSDSKVTSNNLSSYYKHTGGTVGRVHPEPLKGVELLRGGTAQGKYDTLSGAITAAQSGDTLKILGYIDLGTTGVEISGKSLTLDLNGKTVTYSGVYSAIVLQDGADLTVTDGGSGGRLKATDSADSAIANDSTGTVTVSGGTVTASSSYGSIIAIANDSTGKVTVTGGTVSATGAYGIAIRNLSTGKVTVTGGTVEATDAAGIAIRNLSTGKITISGSAVVTSENTFATEGTIYFREVPTPAAVVLEIIGGTVKNTASPADNSVYFYPDSVTVDNLSSYYSHTGGTVGRVHPAPPSAAPTVSSVTVSPNPAAVQKGMTQQFTAIVSGTNNPAQTVSWTVTGGKTGTDISNTGLLTVAADETAATLTVTAISAVDTTKSGSAAVTVQSDALTDAQKLAMAKSAIAAALDHLTVTNAATAQDILDAANVATLYGVAVAWDGTDGFSKTEATTGAAGSITGTLRLTLNGENGTVTVSKIIAILPDKTALTTAIAAANSAKNSVVVRDLSPSSVASGTRFVTTVEMETLNIAIAAAQTVMDNSAAAAAEITAAVSALNRAVTAFNGAIKTGTYTGGSSSGSGGSSGGGSGGGTVTPPTEAKPSAPTESEIKVDGKVDANGSVTVTLPEKTVDEAIKKAEDEARKNGNLDNGVTLVLNVRGGGSAGSVTVNLPKTTQETIISKKIVNTVIVVNNPDIKIGMDLSAVTSINTQAKADVNITATKQDNSKLTGNAKTAIGARPVFDLRVNYGGGKQVADFDGGSVSVAIPYTLGAGEKAGGVYAVYVDGSGNVQWLTSSVYDAENKVLRFNTNHFSTYGVGYQAPADFTDIAGHWAEEDIQFVVNRGLLSGTGAAAFSPNTAMTRGMFVTALGRLAGADVSGYKQSSFTDVKADAYYMSYVEWAAKNGIVKGTTSATFAPDNAVTREQMAVMVANYAKAIGFELPKAHAQNTFVDAATISPWAADSVKAMQMAGVLAGKNINRFDPQGTAARAEAAATLRHFMELMIDASAAQGWIRSDNGQWMYYENGSPVKNTTRNVGGENYSFNTYGVTLDFPKRKTGFGTYTVQAGDSFWLIAEKHNVSMHTLAEVNGKTIYSVIHPGDALKIPQ
ncbi:S-layer homology domain-containing protein [Bacilliculturomica massiliensis]|uniref:S-layer homology domain-containing protein n=1 Tax=Bacilliculturomica massiliensis TaxID=1917867 RepID=UPI001A914ECC|nr:S-layer homology domain-containing protein [Bacilliculturomica massiliensis]